MKKFITAAALLAASGALASAATTTVDLVTLAGTSAQIIGNSGLGSGSGLTNGEGTTLGGADGNSGTVDVSASDVGTYIGGVISKSGFYYGSGTLNSNSTATLNVSPTITDGTVSFTIFARVASWYGGFAALAISVEDILEQNSTATIDDITSISYTFTTTQTGASSLTAWVVTGSSASQLTVNADGTIAVSGLSDSSYIVLLVSTSTPSVYDGITLSATTVIPEPSAFGLLAGVGALALVAARRRRTKKA